MDIHKPKPWRGWREFLREYVIIVVGVLTALAAEALVEKVHENRQAAEAREAVRDEMNVDITNVGRRIAIEPCITRRLDEIAALLDRAQDGGSFAPPTAMGGPGGYAVYKQRWEAATAGGRTSLLSSEEQRAFGRVYHSIYLLDELAKEERLTWSHLQALIGLRRLSPEMIYGQRIALAEARSLDRITQTGFGQAKYFAGLIGVKGDARLTQLPNALAPRSTVICQPLSAPPPNSPEAAAHGRP